MAYYSCTTTNGCSATSITTGTYASQGACKLACMGWGCGPSPDLAPDADILFVIDASGSFPTSSVEEYFKATTAWTQSLTQNGWTGDANWVASYDFEGGGSFSSSAIDFYANDGSYVSTSHHVEQWLSWAAIPMTCTNLKPDGTKDFVVPQMGDITCTNDGQGWGGWYYCSNPGLNGGNPLWTMPGADQYFTKYTVRPNLLSTGFTYPTNDQLVITISEMNMGYNYQGQGFYQNSTPTPSAFQDHYKLWDKIWTNKPANRNYKAWAIPATYQQPLYPHGYWSPGVPPTTPLEGGNNWNARQVQGSENWSQTG